MTYLKTICPNCGAKEITSSSNGARCFHCRIGRMVIMI